MRIVSFDYKDMPHTIKIPDKEASTFEEKFFPLNKYSILTIIPEKTPDKEPIKDEDIDKYIINTIEDCVFQ